MSHRSSRRTLVPVASGLAAVLAASWLIGAAQAHAATGYAVAGNSVQGQEWWLGDLHVTQTWRTTEGAGITVAVLGTGVDAGHPDLIGSVTTGPDFSGSGRTPGGPFWGIDGTEVAGVIAGHGHGTGREGGLLGIAPAARILSIRVGLEFNDPLNSDRGVAQRLPGAIASGIIYAVDHGARIIDLPLDPGTTGLTGQGNPAAAGGSAAERAAVSYALRKNVVLVAPAGDDGQGAGLVNYPAAYPGVIAVGAIVRDGQVAPFSSRRSYVSLTAPGVGLMAAVPPDGYARISSTSTSSGIVAGVAALILSRFPHLTVAQVSQALTGGTTAARAPQPGAGHGIVDAAQAVGLAASVTPAGQPSQRATAPARPHRPERLSTIAAHRASASALAGSLVRAAVAGLCVLIVLLVVLLLVVRTRRERARARAASAESGSGRTRARGQHEQRKLEARLRPEGRLRPGARVRPGHRAWRSPPVSAGSARTPAGPARTPAGPAGRSRRVGRHRRLARRGPGRDAAVFDRAVPAGHDPGAEAGQGGQGGRRLRRAPLGARTGAPAHDRAAADGDEQRAPAGSGSRDQGARGHGGAARRVARLDAARALPRQRVAGPGLPAAARGRRRLRLSRPGGPADPGEPRLRRGPDPGRLRIAPGPRLHRAVARRRPGPQRRPRPGYPGPAGPAARRPPGAAAANPGYIWDLAATDVFPAAADPGPRTEAPGAVPEDGEPGASVG